jgi:hypothetical protein
MEVKVGKNLATKNKLVEGQQPKKIDCGKMLVNVR